MPLEPFKSSQILSIGVELELQLVNLSDNNLTASSPDLLYLLGRKPFPGAVKPEITESMIEIATDVQTSYSSLLEQLQEIKHTLVQAADKLNIGICGGGTHPFQNWSEQKISSTPRYREVSALYGYLAKQFTVFGQHVHIGCQSGDDGLLLLHSLNRYIPHFIALSASSPFIQRRDTLFNSARLNSVFAFPLSGRAPFILSWDSFVNDYYSKMERTGIVKSMKDFYWDIRPKPEFGTIELRVCDTPLTVERAAALAGYMQSLCKYLLERRDSLPTEDDYLVYNYNRFQACRFGLEGSIIHPQSYETLSIREDILATLRKIEPDAQSLGSMAALELLRFISHAGSDAHYLRKQYVERGSPEGIVDAALSKFRTDRDP
jgi:carboxylate-amine ligase